jgi:hypothetical protein
MGCCGVASGITSRSPPKGIIHMEAVGLSQTPGPQAFALDISLTLILFVVKVALLAGILTLVSRREADTRLKTCTLAAALLSGAYFLFNTNPEAVLSIRAFLVVTLVGTLLCMKVFSISLESSLFSCLLFCCLSILMSSYTQRWVDRLIPDRPTIGNTLAAAIDTRVRKTAGDASLPPSTGVMPAALRLALTPGSDGAVDALLAPLRSAQRAKAQIAVVSKQASEEASLVNMLSGAGTNVRGRAEELAALHQGLRAEATGSPGPSDPVAPPTALAPAAAPSPTTPPVPVAAPVADPIQATAAPAAPVGTPAAPARTAPASPSNTPVRVAPPVAAPPGNPVRVAALSGVTAMSAEDRQRWQMAQQQIRVSNVGWTSNDVYVVINRRVLRVGSTYKALYLGNEYTFRFRGVNMKGACIWEPVVSKDEPVTDFIAF